MNEPISVELLVNTGSNKKGDVRVLDPERAKAWIAAGWARPVERGKPGRNRANTGKEK